MHISLKIKNKLLKYNIIQYYYVFYYCVIYENNENIIVDDTYNLKIKSFINS